MYSFVRFVLFVVNLICDYCLPRMARMARISLMEEGWEPRKTRNEEWKNEGRDLLCIYSSDLCYLW
jgi:hypothetical protein